MSSLLEIRPTSPGPRASAPRGRVGLTRLAAWWALALLIAGDGEAAGRQATRVAVEPETLLRLAEPTPPKLPPYAELRVSLRPLTILKGGLVYRPSERGEKVDTRFKVIWKFRAGVIERDATHSAAEDGSLTIISAVPWCPDPDLKAKFSIHCEVSQSGEPFFRARSVEIDCDLDATYTLTTSKPSVLPGDFLPIYVHPLPDESLLRDHQVVKFDDLEVRSEVTPPAPMAINDGLIMARVPEALFPGSQPKIRVMLGDLHKTVSEPLAGFTVAFPPGLKPAPSGPTNVSGKDPSTASLPLLSPFYLAWWVGLVCVFSIVVGGLGWFSITLRKSLRRLQILTTEESERLRQKLQEATSQGSEESERLRQKLREATSQGSEQALKFNPDDYLSRDRARGHTPEVPSDLRMACSAGRCVIVIGNGVAAQAGRPTLQETTRRLLQECERRKPKPTDRWEMLRRGNEKGLNAAVGEIIRGWFDEPEIFEMVKGAYVVGDSPSLEVYRILRLIPAAGVLNLSWDDRYEAELRASRSSNWAEVLTSSDVSRFEGLAREPTYFLVHVNGTLDESRKDAFVFSHEDYRRKAASNLAFTKFVEDCLVNRTLLFVGTSLEAIDLFFTGLKPRPAADLPPRHFALVREDKKDFDVQCELFKSTHGIELIGFTPTSEYPQMLEFLAELRNQSSSDLEKVEEGATRMPLLDEVRLTNIGPFDSFVINLHEKKALPPHSSTSSAEKRSLTPARQGPSWNVLLGNNGCGKSTLLRAVALGLCGDDREAREAGARLLKSGTTSGSIELKFGDRTYKTTLQGDPGGAGVLVQSGVTPLQVGRWVALGFAALRGASKENPSGPGADGKPVPVVRDVLPLLKGNVDWRFDGIKQWIINTDTKSRREGADAAEKAGAKQMLETFFRVLKAFVPGVALDFSKVDDKYTIFVKTSDGEVAIDHLSQGTGAVLGWVGALIQRMHEIYPKSPKPEDEPALVLIDEIDAHMHPEWQHAVVGAVRKVFPNVQVVATTHSPLIVGDLSAGEVTILRRHEETRKIEKVDAGSQDYHGLRFDQILTSPLFGLQTSRSGTAEDKMKTYQALKRRAGGDGTPLGDAERDEYDRLGRFITEELNGGETETQREIERTIMAAIKNPASFPPLFPKVITTDQLRAFRESVETGRPEDNDSGPSGRKS